MDEPRPVLVTVLGLGNTLRQDEGVGVHAVRALKPRISRRWRGAVQCLEGGIDPFATLSVSMPPCESSLVVIDAAHGGESPGTVYRMGRSDLEVEKPPVSLHGLGMMHSLLHLEMIGLRWRDAIIFGVEPSETGWGGSLSPAVATAMDWVVAAVEDEVDRTVRAATEEVAT